MNHRLLITLVCAIAIPGARAQSAAPGPTRQTLDDAVHFGGLATLAPLCGLRDGAWAADLRQALVQSATGADAHDAPALQAAPGSNLAVAALAFADTEALESFAEADPAQSCTPLAHNPDLPRADARVRAWRARKDSQPLG